MRMLASSSFSFLLEFCSRSSAPYGPGMCTTACLQLDAVLQCIRLYRDIPEPHQRTTDSFRPCGRGLGGDPQRSEPPHLFHLVDSDGEVLTPLVDVVHQAQGHVLEDRRTHTHTHTQISRLAYATIQSHLSRR